jgi:ATP-dependent DNA ligase
MPTKKKNRQRPVRYDLRSPLTRKPPAFVTPMAAQVVKRLPEGDEWVYELKFDGYRALIIKDKDESSFDPGRTRTSPGCIRESRRQACG